MIDAFGSQSIIASLDISKNFLGHYHIFDYKKRKAVKIDMLSKIQDIQTQGIGEILINFINRDGLMNGVEEALLKEVHTVAKVPLIYCGGIGRLDHIKTAFKLGADAVAAGSLFCL